MFGLRLAVDRSYVFRLSAPTIPTGGDKRASGNGVSRNDATSETNERGQANGQKRTPAGKGGTRATQSTPSPMSPPPAGRVSKRNSEPHQNGRSRDGGAAQPKAAAGGEEVNLISTPSQAASEEEAMLAANLPSSFGAARDKPLGKKAMRKKELVPGGAGAGLSGVSGRFVASKVGIAGADGSSAADKAEARRRREAEIAAMTAELTRTDDAGDGGEKGDRTEQTADRFTPGGWRHSGTGAAGRGTTAKHARATGGRLGGDDERDEMEEEERMEDDEEQEEEITEEMRIRHVVRRLGLPVSHEVNLSGHSKGVTALALDRAGGRVATGSNDYKASYFF